MQDLKEIFYIDRSTQKIHSEKVYGLFWLKLLYGQHWLQKLFSFFLLPFIVKSTLFSRIYGFIQSLPWSKKKIKPFIQKFTIDPGEFEKDLSEFHSFNDFFTRKLKPDARPIFPNERYATLPADGRYLCFPNLNNISELTVKNERLKLSQLLTNEALVEEFQNGSLVVARLCPTDYHRFHFPVDANLVSIQQMNGPLYSVNPLAWKQRLTIFCENKRTLCTLLSPTFGKVLIICVGATNVGSITLTAQHSSFYKKGDELGYFSFGGSSLLLFFKENSIVFEDIFLENSKKKIEVKSLVGSSLGKLS